MFGYFKICFFLLATIGHNFCYANEEQSQAELMQELINDLRIQTANMGQGGTDKRNWPQQNHSFDRSITEIIKFYSLQSKKIKICFSSDGTYQKDSPLSTNGSRLFHFLQSQGIGPESFHIYTADTENIEDLTLQESGLTALKIDNSRAATAEWQQAGEKIQCDLFFIFNGACHCPFDKGGYNKQILKASEIGPEAVQEARQKKEWAQSFFSEHSCGGFPLVSESDGRSSIENFINNIKDIMVPGGQMFLHGASSFILPMRSGDSTNESIHPLLDARNNLSAYHCSC